jgi:4-amino-4-deoxy-L-arabinose transferase-like glycosyltransferase
MNTDEGLRDRDERAPAEPGDADADVEPTEPDADPEGSDGSDDSSPDPSWWHRDHPTFSALTGFFTGLVVVLVVPGGFAAVLRTLFDYDTAEDLFPFVLVVFAVPLVLIAVPRTRRFGRYMLLGMLATAAVVIGVAALVVWILIMTDG